jgi:hypothetical protein
MEIEHDQKIKKFNFQGMRIDLRMDVPLSSAGNDSGIHRQKPSPQSPKSPRRKLLSQGDN